MAALKSIALLVVGTGAGYVLMNVLSPNEKDITANFPKPTIAVYQPFAKKSDRVTKRSNSTNSQHQASDVSDSKQELKTSGK